MSRESAPSKVPIIGKRSQKVLRVFDDDTLTTFVQMRIKLTSINDSRVFKTEELTFHNMAELASTCAAPTRAPTPAVGARRRRRCTEASTILCLVA